MGWAGLQGSAPASTRGLSVVSYNIGALTDDTFSSEEKKPAFIKKLRQDLGDLCRDTDIICLQEVDHFNTLERALGSIGYLGK